MASSRPAAFVLETDEDWGTLSPLPTTSSKSSAVTFSSDSGESLNYVHVGAALAGGGV